MNALFLEPMRGSGFKQAVTRLAWFSVALWMILAVRVSTYAQSSPPSRPILFVHGWCGSPYDWAPLFDSTSVMMKDLPSGLYTNQHVYIVVYDSATGSVSFWQETDPSRPPDTTTNPLTQIDESAMPPDARFFVIAFFDPNPTVSDPYNALAVSNVSILNKANEISEALKHIESITGQSRVNIIAHSMGGLDSRAYVENLASTGACYNDSSVTNSYPDYSAVTCSPGSAPYRGDVANIITLDTPHAGSQLATPSSELVHLGLIGACTGYHSTNMSELLPLSLGGSGLIEVVNYDGLDVDASSPTQNTVPVQAIQDFFTDLADTAAWNTLPGESDDIVTRDSQAITADSYSATSNLPGEYSSAALNNIAIPYVTTDTTISNTSGCWDSLSLVGLPVARVQVLHYLSCIGALPPTQTAITTQLVDDTVPWITSWQVSPGTISLGGTITVQYTASDLSSSTLSTAELWRAPYNFGQPLAWEKVNSMSLSGNGPTRVTFRDTPTEAGIYIYGTHLFDSSGNEALEPNTSSVTVNAATQVPTVTLQTSSVQVTVGASVTLTATVQSSVGTPTGTVTFYDGSSAISSAIALNNVGTASYTTGALSSGIHNMTAKYGGSSSFPASTSPIATVTVSIINPQLTITPSSGTAGTTSFLKTDAGFTPYGLITHTAIFPDTSVSVLQTYADANGTYSYSRTYSMEGAYSQIDTDEATGKTTAAVPWTVVPAVTNDFALSVSPSSQTVSQGGSVSYNVVTATSSGSDQTVTLSASNVPTGLIATFSPASVASGTDSTLAVAASSSATTGTYTITVSGAGANETHTYPISVSVVAAATGPAVTLNPSIVRFNAQSVGSVSSPETVLLMNSGSGQLIVNQIALAAGSDYMLNLPAGAFPVILNPLVPYNIQVSFAPSTMGARPGEIIVYDNAPNSPQTIALSGNGTAAEPTMGTINIAATLNGQPITDPQYDFQYTLSGPTPETGYSPYSFSVSPGSYTVSFTGMPDYLTLSGVTPTATQAVSAGGTIEFTLNFTSPSDFEPPYFGLPSGNPTQQLVPAGGTATYDVVDSYFPGNAPEPFTFSVTGEPAGSTVTFDPQPSPGDSTLTIGTSATETPAGIYTLTLSATNPSGLTKGGAISALAVTLPPAIPVEPITLSVQGGDPNAAIGWAFPNSLSADGRYVVFDSGATNMTSSGATGILVRDRVQGSTQLASVSNAGVAADGFFGGDAISADGRYVVFASSADNLGLGSNEATNGSVYVRDLVNGKTEREDVANDGTPGDGESWIVSISADGRFVAFVSNADNLVSGASGTQVYRRDRGTGQIVLVSQTPDGSPADGSASSVAMSADGRYVAFDSTATDLVSQPTGGTRQTYLRDMFSGTTSLISESNSGQPANGRGVDDSGAGTFGPIVMSADGRYIVFSSAATNLVPQALDGSQDHLFVRDTQGGTISLVDEDSVGVPIAGLGVLTAGYPSISQDGRYIAFYCLGQVVVRDMISQQIQVVSVDGNGNTPASDTGSPQTSIQPSGTGVAFTANANSFISGDSNTATDMFFAANPFVGSVYLQSISLQSLTAPGGAAITGTVTLNSPAPSGGASVAIWADNSAAQPPAEVIVPAGATSVPITIPTSVVSSESVMTVIASYGGGSGVAVLTLEPAPELTVSPETWDFGYQAVNTTSSVESFVVSNSGTAALAVNSIQLATGQVFKISANTCGSAIAAGGSCSVSATFDPSASGSASDAVQISYGNPEATFSISLTGNGATPVAVLTPAALSFGNQSMPGISTEVATLMNSGDAPLSSIFASISGTNAAEFSISSDGCSGVTLPANSSCLVTVSFSPKAKGSRVATLSISDSASSSPQTTSLSGTGVQSTPTIIWSPSATSVSYGTPLGAGVLDATATLNGNNLGGTFAYTATVSGGTPQPVTQTTVLAAGSYTLTATFTPTDTTDYTGGVTSATLVVSQDVPTITWATPAPIVYGTALGASQLNATATVGGTFTYSPGAGTVPSVGAQTLSVTFTPSDTIDYTTAAATVTLTVNQAVPTITWAAPGPITYGTALSGAQLNASSAVAGSFAYSPAAGAVLEAGSQTLSVTLTPSDSADYATATDSVTLIVNKAAPVITWPTPAAIVFGTALSTAQLNATASVAGSFVYSPAAGTIPAVGNDTLSVQFTPSDSTDYSSATATVTLSVVNAVPLISSLSPAFTSADGSALTLTVNGSGFATNSTVYWGPTALTTTYGSATTLTAQIPASDITAGGATPVTVQTPAPGGGTSNPMQFEVDSGAGTPPTFTTITATVSPGSSATFPVTLPSSATDVTVTCLNPPAGASCTYSSTNNAVTISTASTTPAGTYQITVVFTETLPGAATAFILLPILLLPLLLLRRKTGGRDVWLTAGLGLVLVAVLAFNTGCGGGNSGPIQPQTHKVTSSGVVTLTVQ